MDTIPENNYAIIMPAYNEGGRIGSTIADIRRVSNADIIVVDDGSSDKTSAEGSAAGAIVITLPFNLGYGAALQTAYNYALQRGYDFAIQMDADGQHDPVFIPVLINVVKTGMADVAIGSRFLGEGVYHLSLTRRAGVLFFRSLASFLTRQAVTDPTSGYQALSRRAMEFCASEEYPVDFPDADVLVMLHKRGIRFTEVPVRMHQNTKRKTMHSGFVPVYYLFKMLLSIVVTLLRNHELRREP